MSNKLPKISIIEKSLSNNQPVLNVSYRADRFQFSGEDDDLSPPKIDSNFKNDSNFESVYLKPQSIRVFEITFGVSTDILTNEISDKSNG